ncbi:hypothetical protein M885DRAFT_616897 [Pelagophyceae sp. CCMP2097]|nr:hypothetical protein M885DRAFT_616897 [Pelagophyceae sp. CCMP2097]
MADEEDVVYDLDADMDDDPDAGDAPAVSALTEAIVTTTLVTEAATAAAPPRVPEPGEPEPAAPAVAAPTPAAAASAAVAKAKSLSRKVRDRVVHYETAVDLALEAFASAVEAAREARRSADRAVAACRVYAPAAAANVRLLVKLPLGPRPIEMWIRVDGQLSCRPPELVECFTRQLARTVAAGAVRRTLSPQGLMLCDYAGQALSVAMPLSASVKPGDVLLLLPSRQRLAFLCDELQFHVDELTGPAPVSEVAVVELAAVELAAVAEGNLDLKPGDVAWVKTKPNVWRKAALVSTGKDVWVVRWRCAAEDATGRPDIDAPTLAQVEKASVHREKPAAEGFEAAAAAPAEGTMSASAMEEAARKRAEECALYKPSALRRDGALRVQIVWRLGAPSEALAIWLRVPKPHGEMVRPRALLRSFISKLILERPHLRFVLSVKKYCLATLDAAPLRDEVPIATSLRALCRRRATYATRKARGDDFARSWLKPEPEAEETLLVLPRLDALVLSAAEDQAEQQLMVDARGDVDRAGWILEENGGVTACTLLRGRNAPARNRLASSASPLLDVALAPSQLEAHADVVEGAGTRASGGDVVVVHTDRRVNGKATLRQVKLSQLIFADELERGYGAEKLRAHRVEDEVAVPYSEEDSTRDLQLARDYGAKMILRDILSEFRRNGELVVRRPAGMLRKRGDVFTVTFEYASLGISVALAEETRPKDGKTPKCFVVVDAIGPACPPQAQLALEPGDELVKVDGVAVSASLEGYTTAVAKLRCGERPTRLSFRKARDERPRSGEAPTLSAGAPDAAAVRRQTNLRAEVVAEPRALEVTVVDLDLDDIDLETDSDADEVASVAYKAPPKRPPAPPRRAPTGPPPPDVEDALDQRIDRLRESGREALVHEDAPNDDQSVVDLDDDDADKHVVASSHFLDDNDAGPSAVVADAPPVAPPPAPPSPKYSPKAPSPPAARTKPPPPPARSPPAKPFPSTARAPPARAAANAKFVPPTAKALASASTPPAPPAPPAASLAAAARSTRSLGPRGTAGPRAPGPSTMRRGVTIKAPAAKVEVYVAPGTEAAKPKKKKVVKKEPSHRPSLDIDL